MKARFIVVYPRGTGRLEKVLTFNGGNCCGFAMNNKVDDVEFTRQLASFSTICQVRDHPPEAGVRHGQVQWRDHGLFARFGTVASHRIAAIAPVGGPMGTEACKPTRPVSVIYFHGSNDENAPFKGGKGKGLSGNAGQVHQEQLGRRPDVRVLPEASDEVRLL